MLSVNDSETKTHDRYCMSAYMSFETHQPYPCNCSAKTEVEEVRPLVHAGWAGPAAPYSPELGR